MHAAPTDIKLKRSEAILEVCWSPEGVRLYRIHAIRCACGCAGCVDEMTGAKILDPAAVPEDIGISQMKLIGHYAVQFTFTDGHDTGIYSWDRLLVIPTI